MKLILVLIITSALLLISAYKAYKLISKLLKEAKLAEEKFQSLAENLIDAIYFLDPSSLKILYCNAVAVEMTNYSQEELTNKVFPELHPRMEKDNLQSRLKEFSETNPRIKTMILHQRKKEGSIFIIELYTCMINQAGKKLIMCEVRDITEKKLKDDSISLFFKATENSLEAVELSDLNKNIIYVNNSFEKMFGYSKNELIGKNNNILYPEETYLKLQKSIHGGQEDGWIGELTGKRKNGSLFSLLVSSSIILNEDKTVIARMATHRDITEKKIAESKMISYTEQLRSLSDHISTIREEERLTLAREIHDGLGSSLTGLKMDLSLLKRNVLECCKSKPADKIVENIKSMSELIDTTLGLMRRIVKELRPEFLEELGLSEAIRWYVSEFEKRTSIKFKTTIFPEDFITDKKRSITIFRIFQEILINIARHSKAKEVNIFLRKKDNTITLVVHDNGIGIKQEDINNIKSFGILGMRERVLIFGGKLQMEGVEGQGTTVKVEIPLA